MKVEMEVVFKLPDSYDDGDLSLTLLQRLDDHPSLQRFWDERQGDRVVIVAFGKDGKPEAAATFTVDEFERWIADVALAKGWLQFAETEAGWVLVPNMHLFPFEQVGRIVQEQIWNDPDAYPNEWKVEKVSHDHATND